MPCSRGERHLPVRAGITRGMRAPGSAGDNARSVRGCRGDGEIGAVVFAAPLQVGPFAGVVSCAVAAFLGLDAAEFLFDVIDGLARHGGRRWVSGWIEPRPEPPRFRYLLQRALFIPVATIVVATSIIPAGHRGFPFRAGVDCVRTQRERRWQTL